MNCVQCGGSYETEDEETCSFHVANGNRGQYDCCGQREVISNRSVLYSTHRSVKILTKTFLFFPLFFSLASRSRSIGRRTTLNIRIPVSGSTRGASRDIRTRAKSLEASRRSTSRPRTKKRRTLGSCCAMPPEAATSKMRTFCTCEWGASIVVRNTSSRCFPKKTSMPLVLLGSPL